MLAVLYGTLVGLTLGLTGGGGAVVAVPLLLYGLHFGYLEATAVSLAIVGATSIFGALLQSRQGHVLWLVGAILGLGGIPTVPLGKWIAVTAPQNLLLIAFALLMTFIGLKMLLPGKPKDPTPLSNGNTWKHLSFPKIVLLLFFGALVGILSGTFGIGGGFFFVPTLDLVLGLPIFQATATSLVGIFLISVSGVIENRDILMAIDPGVSLLFFVGSAFGMVAGTYAKNFFRPRALEIIFGCFVLGIAAYVLSQNL
jgi:uncharacterized membrane protein YfcA